MRWPRLLRGSFAALAVATLAACATLDQPAFEREVAGWVHADMPAADAITGLQSRGFACIASHDADAGEDCTRVNQHILPPVTCVESVGFAVAGDRVRRLGAVKIICTGL